MIGFAEQQGIHISKNSANGTKRKCKGVFIMKKYASSIESALRAKRRLKNRTAVLTTIMMIAAMLCNGIIAFAEGEGGENAAPSGVGGSNTKTVLISVIFWVIRGIIGVIGAAGLLKAVQAQADEDPRGRNAGFTTLAVAAFGFAGTFAIEALI